MKILSFLVGLWLMLGGPALAAEGMPAGTFFPVLPMDAPDGALPQFVPLSMNRPVETVQRGTTRAIIAIHDESRDAKAIQSTVSALGGGLNSSTIILAPQFMLPSDISRFSDFLPDKGRHFASWDVLGWSIGDDSVPTPPRKSISSFTVVDLLLMYLSDKAVFPDLKVVIIAGCGVGGNFVQRYAAFSAAADILAKEGISLRFVVGGATSYLYLTSSRPSATQRSFVIADPDACPTINSYPYGLEKLNPYARRIGANAAKIDYGTRAIVYLNAHASDAVPEGGCAAMAQGSNGENRAANFQAHLAALYGDAVQKNQSFGRGKGGNGAVPLFSSPCGMSALFGDGLCFPIEED